MALAPKSKRRYFLIRYANCNRKGSLPAVFAGFPATGRPDSRPAGRLRLRGAADSAAGRHGYAAAYAHRYPAPGHSGYFPDALPRPDFGISIPARPAVAAFNPDCSAAADRADQSAANADRYPGAGSSAVSHADTDACAYAGRHGRAYTRPHALNHAGPNAKSDAANFAAHADTHYYAHANSCAPAHAHALAQGDDY